MKKHLIIASIFAFIISISAVSLVHAQIYAPSTTYSPYGGYSYSNDIGYGSRGSEVTNLQGWLINHGFAIPAVNSGATDKGYFGIQTREALIAYQNSVGLPATGYLDSATRNRIGDFSNNYNTYPNYSNPNYSTGGIYANPTYPTYVNPTYPNYTYPNYGYQNSVPVITSVDAPTTLTTGQMGTWTVRATDPYNGTLSYSVDWGDTIYAPAYASAAAYPQYNQTATFTHSYANAGTYTARFTVRNSSGQTAQSSATVRVDYAYGNGGNGAGPLRIISPNGGEIWQTGTIKNITWTSPYYFQASYVTLKLVRYNNCTTSICPMIAYAPYSIATNISSNQNSYSWRVGNYLTSSGYPYYSPSGSVPDGQYTIQICDTNGSNCESSDSPFTISSYQYGGAYPGIYPTYPPYQQPIGCPIGYICRPI